MFNLSALKNFFSPSAAGVDSDARQAKLDDHISDMPEYIAKQEASQVLRFLQLYARKADVVGLDAKLGTVLQGLQEAGYDGNAKDPEPGNPTSYAKFAVSTLISAMAKSSEPPHPQLADGLAKTYIQSLPNPQTKDI